jgi:hypothetical protein
MTATFPVLATAHTILGIGIWTAATSGTYKVGGPVTSYLVSTGVKVQYASGSVTFTVS